MKKDSSGGFEGFGGKDGIAYSSSFAHFAYFAESEINKLPLFNMTGFPGSIRRLRVNPSDDALIELKQSHNYDTEKKRALTVEQQEFFLDYLKNNVLYNH